jgi:transcriptional regulator with XRE-family HTH domain
MRSNIGAPISKVNLNNRYAYAGLCKNIGMSIGERIRAARKRAGMTQPELAKKVGMKQATLSQLETGESKTTRLIGSIAHHLGVNALWLETGRGEPVLVNAPAAEPAPRFLERLDADEHRLIQQLRSATDAGRASIFAAADSCEKNPDAGAVGNEL